jgi:hypothetical protein
MYRNLAQTLKIFFSPETIVPFLISSVVLSILGNSIFGIVTNQFGTKTPDLIRIAVVSLLILGLAVFLVYLAILGQSKRFQNKIPDSIKKKLLQEKYRGLILLVSRKEPCIMSIDFHRPKLEYCWLICSATTLELANQLRAEYAWSPINFSEPIVINDVYDPLEVRDRVKEIYEDDKKPNNLTESEIIADYVGMTAHASVGMVLACMSYPNCSLQYTPAQVDKDGRIIGSLSPIKVTLS